MKNNENILDFIFDARSEELAKLTAEDREFYNSQKINIKKEYKYLIDEIEEVPEEIQENIKKRIQNYCDAMDLIHAYFYKKYYKMGFSECFKLILACIKI